MIVDTIQIEHHARKCLLRNKKIVLAGGCFDILHEGHISFLANAKKEGAILFVLLESDLNIRKLKGKNRPVNLIDFRARELEKLGFIDFIVLLEPNTSDEYYLRLTKLISPDIIAVTNNDPLLDKKKNQAKIVAGRVAEVMKRDERFSSSNMIEDI